MREQEAREKFDVYTQRNECQDSKKVVRTRWVLTWEMVDGKICVKARLAAKGFQDPDSQEGIVDTSGPWRIHRGSSGMAYQSREILFGHC